MGRKEDEEKEAAREREEKEAAREKEAKRKAAREIEQPVAAETTITGGLPAQDYLTEQEKNPGSDPVSPAVDPVPAEILDIPTKQPYPTGGM